MNKYDSIVVVGGEWITIRFGIIKVGKKVLRSGEEYDLR